MSYPIFLQDAYVQEMDAQVLEVNPESSKKWQVILDKTVFYPKGGGQPTDQGILSSEIWQGRVYQVLQKEDKIIHYVEADNSPTAGMTVRGKIDWERRYLHMRLHSAAHVIDFALYLLGYSPAPLSPVKGDHGKNLIIWYQGVIDKDFREELENKSAELISQNLPFTCRFVSYEELEREAIYLQPGLPKNKPLRILTLKGVGSVADGGTQVHSTAEVGSIGILPLEKKDGMTLVRYTVK
jgi:alanyl-tRNA synthetase